MKEHDAGTYCKVIWEEWEWGGTDEITLAFSLHLSLSDGYIGAHDTTLLLKMFKILA